MQGDSKVDIRVVRHKWTCVSALISPRSFQGILASTALAPNTLRHEGDCQRNQGVDQVLFNDCPHLPGSSPVHSFRCELGRIRLLTKSRVKVVYHCDNK